jgi:NitT/TauT family transport system permease protein
MSAERPAVAPSILSRIELPWAAIMLVALIALWEAATVLLKIPGYLLPSPSAIGRSMAMDWKLLVNHSWVTAMEIVVGFLVSLLVGIPIAICVTYSRLFERAIYPLIVGSQTVPKVALAPILLAWFGFGIAPKIIIVVLVAFFPIVINTVVGLKSVPIQIIHLARSMGATPIQIFWRFRLPHALPSIFAGMKMATILAVIGATVAEFVGAEKGTGYLIMVSGADFNMARQFSAIVVLSAFGILFFWLVSRAERIALPWHVSVRAETH